MRVYRQHYVGNGTSLAERPVARRKPLVGSVGVPLVSPFLLCADAVAPSPLTQRLGGNGFQDFTERRSVGLRPPQGAVWIVFPEVTARSQPMVGTRTVQERQVAVQGFKAHLAFASVVTKDER